MYKGIITLRKNSNVIAINHTVPCLNVLRKDELHETLERTRHAGQSKRSTNEFVQARGSSERRLTHCIVTHAELMKPTEQVDLREQLGATGLGNKIARSRSRKPISDSLRVQHAVINDHAQLAILLGCKEHRRRVVGIAAPDNTGIKKSFDLAIQLRLMMRRNRIRAACRRLRALPLNNRHVEARPNRWRSRLSASLENIALKFAQSAHDLIELRCGQICQLHADFLLHKRKRRALTRRDARNIAQVKLSVLRQFFGKIQNCLQVTRSRECSRGMPTLHPART